MKSPEQIIKDYLGFSKEDNWFFQTEVIRCMQLYASQFKPSTEPELVVEKPDSTPITITRLEDLGFKLVDKSDVFEHMTMPYYVNNGLLLFFNRERTEYEAHDYLVGFGSMRQGKYHCVTFRWISTIEGLNIFIETLIK